MKKLLTSIVLSFVFAFKANAVVWLVPLPEVFLALMGAGGIAVLTDDKDHSEYGVAKSFYYDTRRLKQVISWPKSYAKGEGLYTRVDANLLVFRQNMFDLFGANTVINENETLKAIVQGGDDLMEISLRDFTLNKHGKKTLGELIGEDKPNYRNLAQLALTVTQICRWNKEKCISK